MEPSMEPNDDSELTRLLREWQAPETPAWLEGRVLAHRDPHRHAARWRRQFAAGLALAATLAAAAMLVVRRPPPLPAAATEVAVAADQPFVPVPYVMPLDSYETARVLRMNVPVAALLAAGYQVPVVDPTATLEADVLVGDDGRAHAVRLVSGLSLEGGGD
jgi:hypothetical protein